VHGCSSVDQGRSKTNFGLLSFSFLNFLNEIIIQVGNFGTQALNIRVEILIIKNHLGESIASQSINLSVLFTFKRMICWLITIG